MIVPYKLMLQVGNSEDVDGTLAVFAEIRAELLMEGI